jgi:beta-catenin-like protein 1
MDVDAIFKVPQAPKQNAKRVKIGELSDDQFKQSWSRSDVVEEEEDEGRMYGSGLSAKDSEILEIVDQAEGFKFDVKEAKSTFTKFEKVLKKNQELRSKHSDNPLKYADSEADLAEQIHHLQTVHEINERLLPRKCYP